MTAMVSTSAVVSASVLLLATLAAVHGQRITTIQLEGVQYFVSRMNPYSPALNYFLAYQYCRSLGLQLASFESREKADSINQYLRNAGYNKYDFWTSGNRLGTDMFIWMSSGLPFNATFDYMKKGEGEENSSDPSGEAVPSSSAVPLAPSANTGRQFSDDSGSNGCVTLRSPEMVWDTDDCLSDKDFICEQTRCYYYNYGSIPVSTAQGGNRYKPPPSTLTPPTVNQLPVSTPSPVTATPLGQLLNFTVNRLITLRPPASTTPPDYVPSLLSRAFLGKDSNIVFLGAVDQARASNLINTDSPPSTTSNLVNTEGPSSTTDQPITSDLVNTGDTSSTMEQTLVNRDTLSAILEETKPEEISSDLLNHGETSIMEQATSSHPANRDTLSTVIGETTRVSGSTGANRGNKVLDPVYNEQITN